LGKKNCKNAKENYEKSKLKKKSKTFNKKEIGKKKV